jgi:hypothetical protein
MKLPKLYTLRETVRALRIAPAAGNLEKDGRLVRKPPGLIPPTSNPTQSPSALPSLKRENPPARLTSLRVTNETAQKKKRAGRKPSARCVSNSSA